MKPNRCGCGKMPEFVVDHCEVSAIIGADPGFIKETHYWYECKCGRGQSEGIDDRDCYVTTPEQMCQTIWNEENDGWVRCDVALPEGDQDVHVCDDHGSIKRAYFYRGYFNIDDSRYFDMEPTHWRDLPELPREKTNDTM